MGYIRGTERGEGLLFPSALEDYVGESNEVRAIAAFVEYLPFDEMGFVRSEPADTGRPGYDPRVLLGVYIWGHINGVRSSRRLERECGRNVELMWLSGLLQPDFKTLCRFRKENGEAISEVLARFRMWCRGAGLFGNELVAIDGSKFKAVNSKQRNVTPERLVKLIEREKERAARYMAELEEADEQGGGGRKELTAEELKEKISRIGEFVKEQEEALAEMEEEGEKQRSLTDPESRMMKTSKGMDVCYNVQTAVDSKHKLIVAVKVTNHGGDKELLPEMAVEAKKGLGVEELTVVADGGYFGHEAIKECEDEKITAYVPERISKEAERAGIFPRDRFEYDHEKDLYVCPAGVGLRRVSQGVRKSARFNKEYLVYGTKKCLGCKLLAQCSRSKTGRKIKRWAHHEVLDRLRERLKENPEILRRRKALVEHPFGTIKVAMNHERLLLKGIKNVGTEIKLTVLSYNLKRVFAILGVPKMIEMLKPAYLEPKMALS